MTINIYLDGALTNTSTTNNPVAQGAVVSASAKCGSVSLTANEVHVGGGGWFQYFGTATVHTNLFYGLDRAEVTYIDTGADPSMVPSGGEWTYHKKGPSDDVLGPGGGISEAEDFWAVWGGGSPAASWRCSLDVYFVSLHRTPTHLPVRTTAGPLLRDATSGKIFRDEVELPVPNG